MNNSQQQTRFESLSIHRAGKARRLALRTFVLCPLAGSSLTAEVINRIEAESAPRLHPSAERPNIVFIMADDMGFSDLGCYGGEADTPNLDRLAAEGVRFSQFYNGGKCEPTRTAFMTGHRNTPEIGFYGERAESFMPAVLGAEGYHTILAGKWHVSQHPLDRGFDRFFGIEEGACNYFTGSGRIQLGREPYEVPATGFYTTDAFTDYALQFLAEAQTADDDQPFFLFLAYTAPHDPLQAPQELIEKYRGRFMEGWHHFKHERLKAVRELGLFDGWVDRADWPQNIPRWDELSASQQEMEDLRMATYMAMTDSMDRNIGRVFNWLEENGEWENSLVIFVSDNGANPFDRGSTEMVEAGILPGGPDSRWSLGTAWAHVSNTPFRLYKRNQHEGGICSPMILRWPAAGYPPGSVSRMPVNVLDFLPTFHALAGGTGTVPGTEGENLTAKLLAGAQERDYSMMGYLVDHRYIREGDWKLVSVDGQPWELFDLGPDRSETDDLATSMPERVGAMESAWQTWYRGFYNRPFSEANGTPPHLRMGDKGTGARYEPSPMPPANLTLNQP